VAALSSADRALAAAFAGDPPAQVLDTFGARLKGKIAAAEAKPELDDLRALAASALVRASESQPAETPEDTALYTSSGALGQVVLPVPEVPRRRRWPAVVGGVAGLLGLVAIVWAVGMQKQETGNRQPATGDRQVPESEAVPVPVPEAAPVPAPAPAPVPAPARERTTVTKKEAPAEPKPAASAAPPPPPPPPPQKSAEKILEEMSTPEPAAPRAEEKAPGNEKLTGEEIKAGMARVQGAVQKCFDLHRHAGVIFLKVKIAPDGTVAGAEPTGAFTATPTGDCVVQAVGGVKFRSFDGPPMHVRYSFKLEEVE